MTNLTLISENNMATTSSNNQTKYSCIWNIPDFYNKMLPPNKQTSTSMIVKVGCWQSYIKVIRMFFTKHNRSLRWHLGDYEKHIFFSFEGLWEEKLWF